MFAEKTFAEQIVFVLLFVRLSFSCPSRLAGSDLQSSFKDKTNEKFERFETVDQNTQKLKNVTLRSKFPAEYIEAIVFARGPSKVSFQPHESATTVMSSGETPIVGGTAKFRGKMKAESRSLKYEKSGRDGSFVEHFQQMKANSDKFMVAFGYFSPTDCAESLDLGVTN